MSESKTSAKRIAAVGKQLKALELRKAGATYQQIADAIGYASPTGAYKAILSALKRTLQEPADAVRKIEIERLDVALFAIWRRVRDGNDYAIDRFLAIEKRRAALLGLDAPVKVAPTDPSGEKSFSLVLSDEELTRRMLAILNIKDKKGE